MSDDLVSHLKIVLPTEQLAAASAVLVDLQLILGRAMSTRAQIAIQIGPEEWVHVYVHFDGYPAHMLPALTRRKPEDIIAARAIRQVTADALDYFSPSVIPASCPAQRHQFEQDAITAFLAPHDQ